MAIATDDGNMSYLYRLHDGSRSLPQLIYQADKACTISLLVPRVLVARGSDRVDAFKYFSHQTLGTDDFSISQL